MNFITAPFSLVLRLLTEMLDSYGLALILFALIVTAIRIPFDIKGKRSTMKQTVLGPQIRALQEKYKGNPQKAQQETMRLYREEGVKPMGGCIWMMFPMVIMLILISIVRNPLSNMMGLSEEQIYALYNALSSWGIEFTGTEAHLQTEIAGHIRNYFYDLQAIVPEIFNINMRFLGMDIGQTPNWLFFQSPNWTIADVGLFSLPLFSVVSMYAQQKIMMATNYMQQQAAQQMQAMKTMMLFMPLMGLWIGFTFPAAMSIYFTVSGILFTIASIFINRHFKGIYHSLTAEMEAREAERQAQLEAKRQETERRRAEGQPEKNKGTSKKKEHLAEREKERQRQAAQRQAERGPEEEEYNPSREGHRKYARGRAYEPERFIGVVGLGGNHDDLSSTDLEDEVDVDDVLLSTDPVEENTADALSSDSQGSWAALDSKFDDLWNQSSSADDFDDDDYQDDNDFDDED